MEDASTIFIAMPFFNTTKTFSFLHCLEDIIRSNEKTSFYEPPGTNMSSLNQTMIYMQTLTPFGTIYSAIIVPKNNIIVINNVTIVLSRIYKKHNLYWFGYYLLIATKRRKIRRSYRNFRQVKRVYDLIKLKK